MIDEKDLLRRAGQGEQDAFRQLVEAYQAPVYRLALRMCGGDAALAETARDTPIIELASAPYGLEMQKAVKLGLQVCVESGLPGRYAPLDAGEALFDALTRAMGTRKEDAQCAT